MSEGWQGDAGIDLLNDLAPTWLLAVECRGDDAAQLLVPKTGGVKDHAAVSDTITFAKMGAGRLCSERLHIVDTDCVFRVRWFGLSEQVPGVFQVVFRLGYAAAASGIGGLK